MESSITVTSESGIVSRTRRRAPRLKFNLEEALTPSHNDDINEFSEITTLTWNVYGVSALFGFKHNDRTVLKLYGKRLREEIAANLPQENVAYNANISVTESILKSNYLPLIKVDVYTKNVNQEDSIDKCIYKGIFLSWKTDSSLNASNSVKLPLLLCRGIRTCMNVVHSTLSRMFDCIIISLPMEGDDLMWLLPIMVIPASEEETPKKNEDVVLEYVVPGLPTTDTITIRLNFYDIIKTLNMIMKDTNNEADDTSLTIEHIKKFRKYLQALVRKSAGIELGLCTLHRINLPAGAIMNNKMKITNLHAMKRVLLYMTEKAVDMFHQLRV